ncbi:sulfotransferase domain-containing protein [Winogradskyella sp. MIT101101]|uniref:sulfotransferase domain-containing protein n=1 Tax=Winogradskyella sp. MIT101101 TaxID=3098297 RepID=UPI00399995A3
MIIKKIEHALRLIYVNSITHFNNSVLVVEYPKSGGTWLTQLISGILKIPFPQNKFPVFGRAIYHSHYQPKYFIDKNKKIVWLVRDGRDIMVSSYFHYLVWNNKNKKNPKLVNYYRDKLQFKNYEDINSNLSTFIEFLFTDQPSKLKFFNYPGDWATYNKKWLNVSKSKDNVYIIRYEDMLLNTELEMTKLVDHFFKKDNVCKNHLKDIVHKFSFENQTKRKPGTEDKSSFLRKGISGDWKNYFDDEAKVVFKKYAGQTLIDLGYEKDDNW